MKRAPHFYSQPLGGPRTPSATFRGAAATRLLLPIALAAALVAGALIAVAAEPAPSGLPSPAPCQATGTPAASRLQPPRPLPAAPPGAATIGRASLAAVGDVLMHGAVKQSAASHRTADNHEGFGWLWAPVADLLAGADLTVANLETPVAPRAGSGSRSFVFNTSPATVSALRAAGVRMVTVANNHLFDQGRAGFEETLAQLEAAGMPFIGAGVAGEEAGPRLVNLNGLRIAFLGYSQFFNQSGNDCPSPAALRGRPCLKASLLDADRAVADVRAASQGADAVVVSLHWGEEYKQEPTDAEVALAHRLADAGALAVVGHHPHVLQPIELYPRADGQVALIAYSLGNFVSNQSRNYVHGVTPAEVAATRDGVLLRVEIVRRDYGRGVTRVELGRADWLPLWTENDTADPERRAAGRRYPSIRVVSLDRALAEVRAELAALPDPVPRQEAARYVRLRQREDLLSARRAAIAEVLGPDLEGEPPPAPTARAPSGSR